MCIIFVECWGWLVGFFFFGNSRWWINFFWFQEAQAGRRVRAARTISSADDEEFWAAAGALPGAAVVAPGAARGTSLVGTPSAAIINPLFITNSLTHSSFIPCIPIICHHHTASTEHHRLVTQPWISRWILDRVTCKYIFAWILFFLFFFSISVIHLCSFFFSSVSFFPRIYFTSLYTDVIEIARKVLFLSIGSKRVLEQCCLLVFCTFTLYVEVIFNEIASGLLCCTSLFSLYR